MGTLRIALRAGEKIFVNGAVMKVDRKTSLEFMNDVTFLLESHVLQADDARTPLRQLYFIVQMILIDPANAEEARRMFSATHKLLLGSFKNEDIRDGLSDIAEMIERDRPFDALKRLRALIPVEDDIMAGNPVPSTPNVRAVRAANAAGASR